MSVTNPTILGPSQDVPLGSVPKEEWFERCVGEFTHQIQLNAFHNETTGEWWVRASDWELWNEELVNYYIKNSISTSETDEFIKAHALSGR